MQKLKDMGVDDNTILVFTTDNGTENFTWPDGGQTPFARRQRHRARRRLPLPGDSPLAWQGICAGKIENGIFSGLDWFPTFVAAAGDPNINADAQVRQGPRRHELQSVSRRLRSDRTSHWKGPSARHEVFYFTESTLRLSVLTISNIASPINRMVGSGRRLK